MKVSQLLESDDWDTNNQETLGYLFKVQSAKCYELYIELKNLDPTISTLNWMLQSLPTNSVEMIKRWGNWKLPENLLKMQQLRMMYDAMIDAKKKYEAAGGKYER